ncbi:MAG: F-type H+-transporting ATPase subunit c [Blastocatellia bacterium]
MIRFRLFVISALMLLLVVGTAMAQGGGAAPAGGGTNLKLLAPFAVGIAAFGGALGDGRAIAGACEGTARNPGAGGRIFTMLLLGLALIETLVLFTFLTLFLV